MSAMGRACRALSRTPLEGIAHRAVGSVRHDGPIPDRHSDYRRRRRLPTYLLSVSATAQSLVLLAEDPDAVSPKPFAHWMIANLPPSTTRLPAGLSKEGRLTELGGAVQGGTHAGSVGYYQDRALRRRCGPSLSLPGARSRPHADAGAGLHSRGAPGRDRRTRSAKARWSEPINGRWWRNEPQEKTRHSRSRATLLTQEAARGTAGEALTIPAAVDLICLSHLRWNFVFQRPQHLMPAARATTRVLRRGAALRRALRTRRARGRTNASRSWSLTCRRHAPRRAGRAHARAARSPRWRSRASTARCSGTTRRWRSRFTRQLRAVAIVYDCMDELSAFAAPRRSCCERERELLRARRRGVHRWPRPVRGQARAAPARARVPEQRRRAALRAARRPRPDPEDQARHPAAAPRLLRRDRRADGSRARSARVADRAAGLAVRHARPGREDRPGDAAARAEHPLAGQEELRGAARTTWRAGTSRMMPFALNEATRFISPTKTPSTWRPGMPVVSTADPRRGASVRETGLVRIAAGARALRALPESTMAREGRSGAWRHRVDHYLQNLSWDRTWSRTAEGTRGRLRLPGKVPDGCGAADRLS